MTTFTKYLFFGHSLNDMIGERTRRHRRREGRPFRSADEEERRAVLVVRQDPDPDLQPAPGGGAFSPTMQPCVCCMCVPERERESVGPSPRYCHHASTPSQDFDPSNDSRFEKYAVRMNDRSIDRQKDGRKTIT